MALPRIRSAGLLALGGLIASTACGSNRSGSATPEGAGGSPSDAGALPDVASGAGGAPDVPSSGGAGGAVGIADAGDESVAPVDRDGGSGSQDGPAPDSGSVWARLGIEDLTTVKKTSGCGQDPGQALGNFVRYTITVNPPPPRGSGVREYFVKLPRNYDKSKPYRLIVEGPGCTSPGTAVFDYAGPAGADGVIQIALSEEPGVIANSCFDTIHADSMEFGFFQAVHDLAGKKWCFDEHRIFVSGHSSGSWMANMMACVYGSKMIRAIAPNSGGLNSVFKCDELPIPGIWSHNETDRTNAFSGTVAAINHALRVNGCTGTFDTSPRAPYNAMPAGVCEQFTTCPKEFPIVICHPKTGDHQDNLGPVPQRAWDFLKAF